jgi:hypothetical protein
MQKADHDEQKWERLWAKICVNGPCTFETPCRATFAVSSSLQTNGSIHFESSRGKEGDRRVHLHHRYYADHHNRRTSTHHQPRPPSTLVKERLVGQTEGPGMSNDEPYNCARRPIST